MVAEPSVWLGAMAEGEPGETKSVFGKDAPPSWDGRNPQTELQRYERDVVLWEFETELDVKKRGARLIRGLTGNARAVVDAIPLEELMNESGIKKVMGALKEHYKPHLEASMARGMEMAIYGYFQEYIIRMDKAHAQLVKEGIKLPEVAIGYIYYRQASLTGKSGLEDHHVD